MATIKSNSIIPGSFDVFGNGLVELIFLSIFIGSDTTEHLMFGNRGALGLAWAGISTFGSIGAIKACISGASPGWLRETLGVRSRISDHAVGMDLDLRGGSYGALKARKSMNAPVGIIRDSGQDKTASRKHSSGPTSKDVYAFDDSILATLQNVPEIQSSDGLPRIFSFADYDFFRSRMGSFSRFVLPLGKFAESYAISRLDGGLLGVMTAIPWAYFFLMAVFIQMRELLNANTPEPLLGRLDIVAGQLPILNQPPGPRKIVLGAAHNPRLSLSWRLMWLMGAIIYTASLLITYLLLRQQNGQVLSAWAGFQVLWFVLRRFARYSTVTEDQTVHRRLMEQSWHTLPSPMKERVLELTMAFSVYQTHVHPRGKLAYKEDILSTHDLQLHFFTTSQHEQYSPRYVIDETRSLSCEVDIKAVVGDTTLYSAAWMMGLQFTPLDVYDTCILILALPSRVDDPLQNRTVAIPAARALSAISSFGQPQPLATPRATFIPRGASNMGVGLTWLYWVPCVLSDGSYRWLHMKINQNTAVIGRHRAEVLSDVQISAALAAGTMNISLKHVDEIKAIVDLSRRTRACLRQLDGGDSTTRFVERT